MGNFGSNLRMEYTIIGREVNLAARLEQAAEPGEILISSETYDLVQGAIQADARDPVLVKGFSEPMTVYAVHPGNVAWTGACGVTQRDRPGMHVEIDAQRADAALPEAIAGLDTALGLTRAMGMKTLYLAMLRRYLEGRKDAPARIRQALDGGDLKTAELLSHSLRGISVQIGATRVPPDAEALEQAVQEGPPREVPDGLLGRLDASLRALIAALDAGLPPVAIAP
ncbi:MAG: adenylate/guanylate cyclase domain-containing protein [Polaromonas sp.]|uniref:adenylate/guanylate cyclase domain-containing protein n=1 Tax=Polaromonas sp. TaxID=1869339 RepID=UPI002731FE2D|nr:adenylate/guanylate cyclase domain-containing protein [Polaromonas sp.]MDP2257967.1 adenylate/guanylate cyclase domain-containing protein [Polaromonas sp.]